MKCKVVKIKGEIEFHCWSFGPNKIDDSEAGDDVVGVLRGSSFLLNH